MRFLRRFCAAGLSLLLAAPVHAALSEPECRPVQEAAGEFVGSDEFGKGLLWKVSGPGSENYVFGTIHVADESITTLPERVDGAFNASSRFVMEVVPDLEQTMGLYGSMFFQDGQTLDQLLSKPLYRRTVEILGSYNLPEQAVAGMKPWAAFLTMSYPADMRPVLDLQLLTRAVERGIETHGLETLEEQGGIFNDLEMTEQLRLLTDTLCHYEKVEADFESMKRLYLQRDLKGLYMYGQSRSFSDNALYERLTQKLLTDRNRVMVERMLPHLDRGGAFIAVGAMHLPGREGVLELLKTRGYQLTRVY